MKINISVFEVYICVIRGMKTVVVVYWEYHRLGATASVSTSAREIMFS